eukprot:TRINITY_DN21446_c0_g1_i1.p1 TRINITY_DN21446_c0_g1~~TRINITY_DN21446_c0_g1_i1.p1  ORF type:complete len:112 (-),score=18.86 TRINITY_DN21446_c0_g1_i1:97-432(-)
MSKVQEEMDEFPSNNTKVSKLSTISKPCTLLPNTPSHLPQDFSPANTRENDNQMSISISFTTTNSSNSQSSQAFNSQHQNLIVAQRSPAFSHCLQKQETSSQTVLFRPAPE